LSVPEVQTGASNGYAELTRLFGQADTLRQLVPVAAMATNGDTEKPAVFEAACQAVEAMEGMADFLFAALVVPRPADMTLPAFLQIGMTLRRQASIDTLERVLMHAPVNAAQEGLRGHALQSLRRAQQRLLTRVLQQVPASANHNAAVEQVIAQLKIKPRGAGADERQGLEQAVLAVWSLSEAAA
jgi:glutamate dehydrogenase